MKKLGEQVGNKEPSSFVVEVVLQQPQRDCALYSWDHIHACLRVTGLYRAEAGLPADLAAMKLENQMEVPIFLLTTHSFPPGTLVEARVLGALHAGFADGQRAQPFALDGWFLVAVPPADLTQAAYSSLEQLPAARLTALAAYVQEQRARKEQHPLQAETYGEAQYCNANEVAHLLRETRMQIKKRKHTPGRGKEWFIHQEEEVAPSWRLIEGFSDALRMQLQQNRLIPGDETVSHAQAEQLIRFVPRRFQKTLVDLLLDDERLLAFLERPLLRYRTGVLKMRQWRSNAGLLLITDRQVLWLRDFLSPGKTFLSGGYIAHSAPLEHLRRAILLPTGAAPENLAWRLESENSRYLRLVMEEESCTGSELFVIEFPRQTETEEVLVRIVDLLQTFLPLAEGNIDRRVRRLPVVDIWQPQGAEEEQLRGLGGIVPLALEQRLRQQLVTELQFSDDEALVSALVPAIEDYHSPVRLIVLTRQALLVLEAHSTRRPLTRVRGDWDIDIRRYDLSTISSVQLRYSLLGSSLSLFVPQADARTKQVVFPFHSPAIAWFRPLFTRLRVALSAPVTAQKYAMKRKRESRV